MIVGFELKGIKKASGTDFEDIINLWLVMGTILGDFHLSYNYVIKEFCLFCEPQLLEFR